MMSLVVHHHLGVLKQDFANEVWTEVRNCLILKQF